MIATCQFIGRTGNQLWQIAATINYALVRGLKYGFPNRSFNEALWPLQFRNLPRHNGGYLKVWTQPGDGAYHEIPVYRNGIALKGFFQSHKYIDHPETLPRLKRAIGYVDQEPKKGVAIHVRRGDYLQHHNSFPVLPNSYYGEAVRVINNLTGLFDSFDCHIFSDDLEWCRKNFGDESYQFHEATNPVTDLFAMSRFEHQIIANSSYSYWAAMLNPNQDKIVICPHYTQYYGPGNKHLDTSTLYPESWKQIRY